MRNFTYIVSGFIVLALPAFCLAEQATITAMAQELNSVTTSPYVKIIRLGDFEEEEAKVGTELNVGDEVRCFSEIKNVELTFVNGVSMLFNVPFRAVVLPSTAPDQPWINLLTGDVQVVTDNRTTVTSGETTLGSKRTRYGIRLTRNGQNVQTEISVYEGMVTGRRLGSRISVETGSKMVLGTAQRKVISLEAADFKRAAAVYATIDTVKSKVAGEPSQVREKVYRELEVQYVRVLQEPQDPVSQRNLAIAQLNLELPTRAMYSLNRATFPEPREAAVIDMLKGVMYNQLGESVEAQRFFKSAKDKDPSVDREVSIRTYKIDPKFITELREARLPSIIIRAQARPSKVAPGERTQIVVRALTKGGKPIPDANVVIDVAEGSFAGTDKTEVSGRTNEQGYFTATWWHKQPSSAAYGFYIVVSKRGFEKTSADAPKVEIIR